LPTADQHTIWTLYNPNPLQFPTQAPYTATAEIQPITTKGHKAQQPPQLLPQSPTPLPSYSFSATLTNFPSFYS
jgi:hypothetical protein